MASKTQKQILASVRESSLAYNYDLTRVDAREYAAPLNVLFSSAVWKDMFTRRNALHRAAAMKGDRTAFNQIEQIDRKVGFLLLQTMHQYVMARINENEGKKITLNEYFNDFVRTKEQHDLFDQFSLDIDSAMFLAEILDSIMTDTNSTLHKLDPSVVLTEFDGIRSALGALKDFCHIGHRYENPELKEIFTDSVDECEEYLRMKVALFKKKYKDKQEELINSGKLDKHDKKKMSDKEYCIDLLANHFFIEGGCVQNNHDIAKKKAKDAIDHFDKEEMEEVMNVVIALFKASESAHMAKEERNTIIKNLPENDTTKKIVKHILTKNKK